jgi:hypothetical protein
MTPKKASELSEQIIAAFGGYSSEAAIQLGDEITTWGNVEAAEAAVYSLTHTWENDWRPTLPQIIRAYTDELDIRTRRERTIHGVPGRGCDGTGWNDGVPCVRCNPYLRQTYNDPDKWARYLEGVPLHMLHEDVKLVHQRGRDVMTITNGMPIPCKVDTFHDPADAPVDFIDGIAAARRGYEAECRENGREPNWKFFDSQFGSALGRALDRLGENPTTD